MKSVVIDMKKIKRVHNASGQLSSIETLIAHVRLKICAMMKDTISIDDVKEK
jgi:hypothetical protein